MARLLFLAPLFAIAAVVVYLVFFRDAPPLPTLDEQAWWGPESLRSKLDDRIQPMKIKFERLMVQELKQYLKTTRKFVPPLDGVGFEYGFNSEAIDSWLQYWQKEYPFEEREKFFNQFPSFKTMIQGLNIHFIHVKPEVPQGTDVVPMLLLHGWPGSVREFYEAIPLLTAVETGRDFAIEVIVPSLPGYGWSDTAVRPGLGAAETAVIMRNLMHRLGHKQYYVQGGDWGSLIGSQMATLYPKEVLGYHTNAPISMAPLSSFMELIFSFWPTLLVEEKLVERIYPLKKRYSQLLEETGYMHLQATKPDTIGVALSDSPAGLLAYILEKFSTWTDKKLVKTKDGGLLKHYTREQLIDNLMVYWSTQSIMTSMRLYAETFNKRHFGLGLDAIPNKVPTWAIQAKHEISYQPPRVLRVKHHNLLNVTAIDDGGHFLAFQLPKVFADDVITSIAGFRKWHRDNKKEEL